MKGWRGKEPHWLTLAAVAGGERAEVARAFVIAAVRAADGSVNKAAHQIGMHQQTLVRAIERLGIAREIELERHRAQLQRIQERTQRKLRERGTSEKKTSLKKLAVHAVSERRAA